MISKSLIFIFISSGNFIFSQKENNSRNWSEYTILNISYQESATDFMSVEFGKISRHKLYNVVDLNLRLGYSLKNDYFNFGINAHYNFFYFLSLGGSLDYYPSINKQSFISFRPEIGINPFSMFSIYYGFSFDSDVNNLIIKDHNWLISLQVCSFSKNEVIWFPCFGKNKRR